MTAADPARWRRLAWFLIAPVVCLILFRKAFGTWFLADDFAWLGLRLEISSLRDFFHIMFVPKAQGTVRVFSDRLFFYLFSSWFGFDALPYRIWVMATWIADLTLATLIGAKLTGSRAAGIAAAVLWTSSAAVSTPLVWASAYNEVLCAFCLLAAFYSRLRWLESGERRWMWFEWTAYLIGFGALEVIVMYPAVAALHALCTDRKKIWKTLPLFVPAAAFAAFHFLLIPKNPASIYTLTIDQRLPMTCLRYFGWALGPRQLGEFADFSGRPSLSGLLIVIAIGLGLAVFAATRIRRGNWIPLFCLGWFVLLIAPVLALPNHMEEYYATIPIAGLAWLGGWAFVEAFRSGWAARVVAIVLAGFFLTGSIQEIGVYTNWYADRTRRMRDLVFAIEGSMREHPGQSFLIQGVDNDLFNSGFQDDPFRILGSERIYLTPGTEGIQARSDLGGLSYFLISPSSALTLLERNQARVLSVSQQGPRDITRLYTSILRSNPSASRNDFIDAGDPLYSQFMGPTWYPAEQGFRWMPKTATVKLSGPSSPSAKLYVTGTAPAALLTKGPVTIRFSIGGKEIGASTIDPPEKSFTLEFALPADLVGKDSVELSIEVSRTYRGDTDRRELGMAFGTFGIR